MPCHADASRRFEHVPGSARCEEADVDRMPGLCRLASQLPGAILERPTLGLRTAGGGADLLV